MPKIALRYVGSDENMQKQLEATDGVAFMEPVDAREVLASGNEDYEVDEDQKALIGQIYDPGAMAELSIPQLQGDDAELMTGLSANKYGRSQVVKAVPDGSVPTASRPQTTTGRRLDGKPEPAAKPRFSQAAEDADNGSEAHENSGDKPHPTGKRATRRKSS